MQNIKQHEVSTFLWFDSNAAEAVASYCAIFPHAKVTSSSAQATTFTIGDQRYVAFNGGPHYELTAAVSIYVACDSQAEVDALWDAFLSRGATESRCGWLVDKYGLSWQIIPTKMLALINDADPAKAQRAVQCMLTQQKIDLAAIERAHAGK